FRAAATGAQRGYQASGRARFGEPRAGERAGDLAEMMCRGLVNGPLRSPSKRRRRLPRRDRQIAARRLDADLRAALAALKPDELVAPHRRGPVVKSDRHVAARLIGVGLEGRLSGQPELDVAARRVDANVLEALGRLFEEEISGARVALELFDVGGTEGRVPRARLDRDPCRLRAMNADVAGARVERQHVAVEAVEHAIAARKVRLPAAANVRGPGVARGSRERQIAAELAEHQVRARDLEVDGSLEALRVHESREIAEARARQMRGHAHDEIRPEALAVSRGHAIPVAVVVVAASLEKEERETVVVAVVRRAIAD